MSLLRAGDIAYAFRFLRLLTTPWEETKAYELGLIDSTGKVISSPRTSEEKSAFNIFHRLVFNIKRLLNQVPGGRTKFASYASALFLLRESYDFSDKKLKTLLERAGVECNFNSENLWLLNEGATENKTYTLLNPIAHPKTGIIVANAGSTILLEDSTPYSSIFGINVYKVKHIKTNQEIFVTSYDLTS